MSTSIYRRNRSKMEINLDILRAVHDGEEKPTRIMSQSKTTWIQLQEGLDFLVESGFIKEIQGTEKPLRRVDKRTKNRYRLSEKGLSVLRYYSREFKQVETLMLSL